LYVADDVAQLIHAYAKAAASASVTRRLSLLMDINRYDDPRVFGFLLPVLTDRREPVQVRSYTLRCIRTTGLSSANFERAATAVLEVLAAESSLNLRVQAALALKWFIEARGVVAALGRATADPNLPLDLRYAAFTSLERVGPTAESIRLLRKLQADELLGPTAQSTLVSWRVPPASDDVPS
jgi:HEAT repeat protein